MIKILMHKDNVVAKFDCTNFYIKNIDKYVLNGEILTLNSNVLRFHGSDISHMESMALNLIDESHLEEANGND